MNRKESNWYVEMLVTSTCQLKECWKIRLIVYFKQGFYIFEGDYLLMSSFFSFLLEYGF